MKTKTRTAILDVPSRDVLRDYLARLRRASPEIDTQLVESVAHARLEHLRARRELRAQHVDYHRAYEALEQRWYDSLARKQPDFSVYDDPVYYGDLWACWQQYSRSILRTMRTHLTQQLGPIIGTPRRVVDLGNGPGMTTVALKQMFPHAHVIGTNLEDTTQIAVARDYAHEHAFDIETDISAISRPVDLVFASEYFEHIIEPVRHVREIITRWHPRVLLIANSFDTRSVGHFHAYRIDKRWASARETRKQFNPALKALGYQRSTFTFWNDRPVVWERSYDAE